MREAGGTFVSAAASLAYDFMDVVGDRNAVSAGGGVLKWNLVAVVNCRSLDCWIIESGCRLTKKLCHKT